MSSNVLAAAARQSLQILMWQIVAAVVIAGAFALAAGASAGWSALAGGGIGSIWTIYMALTLFRHSVNHGVRLGPLTMFAGWAIKVALTISLLIVAFRSGAVAPLPLLAGLFGAMVAYWAWLTLRVKHADGVDGK